jgi:hypothetical protein
MVSTGISSFKRAVASARVQPLNVRNVRSAAAAWRNGRLPPLGWLALTLAQQERAGETVIALYESVIRKMRGSVHSLRASAAGTARC